MKSYVEVIRGEPVELLVSGSTGGAGVFGADRRGGNLPVQTVLLFSAETLEARAALALGPPT